MAKPKVGVIAAQYGLCAMRGESDEQLEARLIDHISSDTVAVLEEAAGHVEPGGVLFVPPGVFKIKAKNAGSVASFEPVRKIT